MKKLKLTALILAITMFIMLCACSKKDDNKKQDDVPGSGSGDIVPDDTKPGDNKPDDTKPDGTQKPDDGKTPDDTKPGDAQDPDDTKPGDTTPTAPSWPDNLPDSGYSGVKLIHKANGGEVSAELDEKGADKIDYITSLIDPVQSNGPKSYSDYVQISAAFKGSKDNYGVDMLYVKHSGKTYLAVKTDKENVSWLKAEAVGYLKETVAGTAIESLLK